MTDSFASTYIYLIFFVHAGIIIIVSVIGAMVLLVLMSAISVCIVAGIRWYIITYVTINHT